MLCLREWAHDVDVVPTQPELHEVFLQQYRTPLHTPVTTNPLCEGAIHWLEPNPILRPLRRTNLPTRSGALGSSVAPTSVPFASEEARYPRIRVPLGEEVHEALLGAGPVHAHRANFEVRP